MNSTGILNQFREFDRKTRAIRYRNILLILAVVSVITAIAITAYIALGAPGSYSDITAANPYQRTQSEYFFTQRYSLPSTPGSSVAQAGYLPTLRTNSEKQFSLRYGESPALVQVTYPRLPSEMAFSRLYSPTLGADISAAHQRMVSEKQFNLRYGTVPDQVQIFNLRTPSEMVFTQRYASQLAVETLSANQRTPSEKQFTLHFGSVSADASKAGLRTLSEITFTQRYAPLLDDWSPVIIGVSYGTNPLNRTPSELSFAERYN